MTSGKIRTQTQVRRWAMFALACMAAALFLAGCSPSRMPASQVPVSSISASAKKPALSPLRIVLIQDKSLSTGETRTPQLTLDDMEPLVELLGQHGGELAVGVISNRSNLSLARLRIDPGPQEPVAPPPSDNSLERWNQQNAWRKEQVDYQSREQSWQQEMQQRVSDFQAALEPILSMAPNAQHSPVWDAVRRANLFLSEPAVGGTPEPHRYALLITDGIDDVGGKPISMHSGTRVLMVNGSGDLGSLAVLKPERFESIAAAVEYIVETESNH